jgi:DNA sulfur modification protein DndC
MKREFRDIKGRDGRVVLKKDGTPAARTYKLEVSKQMLERLLSIQEQVLAKSPDPDLELISKDEVLEIRRIWRTERQDWEDSVPDIYRGVTGKDLEWPIDDNGSFDANQKALLESLCKEEEVPFELLAKLLEAERQSDGMARRAEIQKRLTTILYEEWRDETEILDDAREIADAQRIL